MDELEGVVATELGEIKQDLEKLEGTVSQVSESLRSHANSPESKQKELTEQVELLRHERDQLLEQLNESTVPVSIDTTSHTQAAAGDQLGQETSAITEGLHGEIMGLKARLQESREHTKLVHDIGCEGQTDEILERLHQLENAEHEANWGKEGGKGKSQQQETKVPTMEDLERKNQELCRLQEQMLKSPKGERKAIKQQAAALDAEIEVMQQRLKTKGAEEVEEKASHASAKALAPDEASTGTGHASGEPTVAQNVSVEVNQEGVVVNSEELSQEITSLRTQVSALQDELKCQPNRQVSSGWMSDMESQLEQLLIEHVEMETAYNELIDTNASNLEQIAIRDRVIEQLKCARSEEPQPAMAPNGSAPTIQDPLLEVIRELDQLRNDAMHGVERVSDGKASLAIVQAELRTSLVQLEQKLRPGKPPKPLRAINIEQHEATEKEEVLQLALVEMETLLKESIIREIELKAERDTLRQEMAIMTKAQKAMGELRIVREESNHMPY